MLKLALALCLEPSRKDEGVKMMEETEVLIHEIATQVDDEHDLLFNLLFEFQMTLHEFNAQQSVQAASESLIIENKKSKHNVLIKSFNTAMQKCFSPDADHAELIKEL